MPTQTQTQHLCADCNAEIPSREYGDCLNADSKEICYDCDEKYPFCSQCAERASGEKGVRHNDKFYCGDCADTVLGQCVNCDGTYHNDTLSAVEDELLCAECVSRICAHCERCGGLGRIGGLNDYCGDRYCNECYECTIIEHPIQSYGFKPRPAFKRSKKQEENPNTVFIRSSEIEEATGQTAKGNLCYNGCEIEVECGDGDAEEVAKETQRILGDIAYMKGDGSLENGFEIVTHPFTLDWAINDYDWKGKLAAIRNAGAKVKRTCGLHIHINKNVATPIDWWKIAFFFSGCQHRIIPFTRRNRDDLNRWARIEGLHSLVTRAEGISPGRLAIIYPARDERYSALNFTPNTVEFRCFKSTLDSNTFLSTLKFINSLVEFAMGREYEYFTKDFKNVWNDYVDFIHSFPEYKSLHAYLARKELLKYDV